MEAKILIIADDPDMRNQLVRAFAGGGSRAFAVPDSGEAFLQFGLLLPDLVILDIPPRGKDRWETVRRVREMSYVPVIALVSREDIEGKSESLDHGADSCLTKPFQVSELRARARALLRRVQYAARSALQSPTAPLYSGRSL
jgi:DNA-binding response OmpR family regulator